MSSKITQINSYADPVNQMFNNIAGTTYYVGIECSELPKDKNGNPVVRDNSDIGAFLFDAHGPQSMYNKIDNSKNGKWSLYEPSEDLKTLNNMCDNVEKMSDPIKNVIANLALKPFL